MSRMQEVVFVIAFFNRLFKNLARSVTATGLLQGYILLCNTAADTPSFGSNLLRSTKSPNSHCRSVGSFLNVDYVIILLYGRVGVFGSSCVTQTCF